MSLPMTLWTPSGVVRVALMLKTGSAAADPAVARRTGAAHLIAASGPSEASVEIERLVISWPPGDVAPPRQV
jgi:hypothetical protein